MTARLVVLGSCGAWPEPWRACSGFVLELDGYRVVIDLGYGTLPRLLGHLGSRMADGVDAVVVTHHHPDHSIDLHGLFRARWLGAHGGAAPLPLYGPRGVHDQLVELEDGDAATVAKVFDWHPLPAETYRLGPAELSSWALPHSVPNAGVRITAPQVTVAYTGDSGPDPALTELGRDADLFIVEATDRGQQQGQGAATHAPVPHLSSEEAGRAAAAAGARRLLLTHFWPGNDRQVSRAAAAASFTGPIELADEGLVLDLP